VCFHCSILCESLTTEFVAVSSNWIAIDMYLAQSVVVFLGKDRNV